MSTFNVVYLREYIDPECESETFNHMKLYTEMYLSSILINL